MYIEREKALNIDFNNKDPHMIKTEIENIPVVDAVPVIYCKDCVAYELVEGGAPYCSTLQMECIGYCAYGERKEDILKLAKDHLDGWPDWKKEIYNNSIAISAHAKKIKFRSDEDGTD